MLSNIAIGLMKPDAEQSPVMYANEEFVQFGIIATIDGVRYEGQLLMLLLFCRSLATRRRD